VYAAKKLHVWPRFLSPVYLAASPIGAHVVNRHSVVSLNMDSSRNTISSARIPIISTIYPRRSSSLSLWAMRRAFFLDHFNRFKTRDIVD
jgi:hypothetical protein